MSRFVNPVPQFLLGDGSVASYGRLHFYENKDFSTKKKTYSQPNNTVENTNPMTLTGEGRLTSCFGDGLYSVKLFSANADNPEEDGALQWSRDDVSLSELSGQFELWNAAETYAINDIAKDPTDGRYYQLWGASTSKGEQPSSTLTKWEKILFITVFNSNKTYKDEEIVSYNGKLYASNQDGNEDTPPSAKWDSLTFNNSITGNLTVSGSVTASDYLGGNLMKTTLPGGVICKKATSAQSIASSTTSTIDTSLSLTGLIVGKSYAIKLIISWSALSTVSAGIKANIRNAGGANAEGVWLSTTNTSTANSSPVSNDDVTYQKLASSSGVPERLTFDGYYTVSATGDLALYWSQSVSDAIQTTRSDGILIATLLD